MSTMQLPPTQSSREVRSQCRSTVCRSCTWANLRQIAHSYWLRFWVYHKINRYLNQNISKPLFTAFEKLTLVTSLSDFRPQNICSFGTLWCNRNHPSSKAWLSHPGATMEFARKSVSVWIFPKIPSSINLVYTQNNSTCQRINILLNQFPCNGCRMMLDACCKFIPALQQVAINILSSVKFMPESCGHQLQLGLILMHSANGIRDIDIFDMWCVTDVYWQLISMILRCQRQT